MAQASYIVEKQIAPPNILSNLPSEIIGEILCHVLIREAVKTSVLSHRWRYLWCSIPDLLFEHNCVNLPISSPSFVNKFVSFVSRVLLLHRGPVRKFEVAPYCKLEFSNISQWLTFVSRNGIEKLSVEFGNEHITVPSSLFLCDKLKELYLAYSESLKLPVSFDGFMLLTRLVFISVSIDIHSLEKLISGCPLLEILELSNSHSEVLKIHAPRLWYLNLKGTFDGFILEKLPLLEMISVTMADDVTKHSCTLVQFIDKVPDLQKLIGLDYFAQYWSVGMDPTAFAITHNHLWFIKLRIDFEDPWEVRLLSQLLIGSPVLKVFEIEGGRRNGSSNGPSTLISDFWNGSRNLGRQLLKLKKATVTTSGSGNEIEFLKFVLLNSPTLETMIVTPSSKLSVGRMIVDLLRCRRASTWLK
ncbi:hypothetical protein MLD38_038410 [Melastoma candidum]|uniref:Uncharacterized protein n=1 Tax=Melastoma candidum TaxID=119954 RepID=A0ACB9L0A5_9MYRT|nr:hypothetical protein MLD38_038410 [Melastoma candidum]